MTGLLVSRNNLLIHLGGLRDFVAHYFDLLTHLSNFTSIMNGFGEFTLEPVKLN
jgi:hypothetical protein